MVFDPLQHTHAGVRSLRPYQPGKPVEELERELGINNAIKLASNENPLGCSPRVRQYLADQANELERYPDGNGFALKRRLAEIHSLDSGCITLGNGSNDVLDLIARVFLSPEKNAVFSQYAFAVYPLATLAVNAQPNVASARTDSAMPMGHNINSIAEAVNANTAVVFIANPNNPTGTWLTPSEISELLEKIPQNVVVVLDEAYRDYQSPELRPDSCLLLKQYPNLVVTRTFSKVHGLAALRVGYSLSSPEIADLLNRVRQPFNVNSLALSAALAALDDEEHVKSSVQMNQAGMRQLIAGFASFAIDVLPSQANFLTFRIPEKAEAVYQALLQRAVIVRPLAGYQMPDWLRVTIGTEAENQQFLSALGKVLKELGLPSSVEPVAAH